MTNELPGRVVETGDEDIESIESSITELYSKFITPIDHLKSIADPRRDPFTLENRSLAINGTEASESRVNCFYRMLGLPVVSADGNHYSPGYDPRQRINQSKKQSINQAISSEDKIKFIKRESFRLSVKSIISRADPVSAVLAYAISQSPRRFAKLNEQTIPERAAIIANLVLNNPQLETAITSAQSILSSTIFNSDCSGVIHTLEPFTTDPFIDTTVTPSSNKICAPFLFDIDSTRISSSPEVLLPRPGIEFIIRERLKDQAVDQTLINTLSKFFTSNKDPTQANATTDLILALSTEADIASQQLDDIFSGFTKTQSSIVQQLIKTIKKVIFIYDDALMKLLEVSQEINFIPLPSISGLEVPGLSLDTVARTTLEKNITLLSLKKLAAESETEIRQQLGNFAHPVFNLEKTDDYQAQLEELTQQKQALVADAWKAINTIEIIGGELTGLGLVDILAIYVALWSMPMDKLLGLLDQDSAERLYNFNVQLRTNDVLTRKNSLGPTVSESLNELSTIVKTVLDYSDQVINKFRIAPSLVNKGEV
jgi:hypothetical protein